MGVWDPSGRQVAYSSTNGDVIEAWIVAADGSGPPRQLTRGGGLVHVDSWSPDGRTVSVHRHDSSGKVTMLMIPVDRADQEPVVFADGETQAESATFSRDGRYVAYLSADTGSRVSPTGSPRAQYDVTADGRRFLMLASGPTDAASGRPRFVVVQNWREELSGDRRRD